MLVSGSMKETILRRLICYRIDAIFENSVPGIVALIHAQTIHLPKRSMCVTQWLLYKLYLLYIAHHPPKAHDEQVVQ